MKTFDVAYEQQRATNARDRMRGKLYQHFKGGVYRVRDIAVDEGTGTVVVIYESMVYGYVWSRSLEEFEELVLARVPRFRVMGGA